MGRDDEAELSATLTVGPTSTGMVRILVARPGEELPMDFDPDEADEIAEELRAAAARARAARPRSGRVPKGGAAPLGGGQDDGDGGGGGSSGGGRGGRG